MDKINASEFSKGIVKACSESKIVARWDTKVHEGSVARIRVFPIDKSFIEVY